MTRASTCGDDDGGDRDRLRFDRSDRIGTLVLLWFVVGGTAAYAVFVAADWFLRRQVTLVGVPVDVAPGAAGAGEVVGGSARAAVLVDGVSGPHLILLLLPQLLTVGAVAWGAWLLSRFLHDLGRGEPFTRANVARLRVVALLLIVVPILAELTASIARTEILQAHGAGDAPSWTFGITLVWALTGLLVAAVAQAFAAGARLRDDVDGLV